MTTRDDLLAALLHLPLSTPVTVTVDGRSGTITVADLLQLMPLKLSSATTTDNVNVRLTAGGAIVGLLPRGTPVDVMSTAGEWVRCVLWVKRDYVR